MNHLGLGGRFTFVVRPLRNTYFCCFLAKFGNIIFNKAALVSLGEEDIGKEGVFYTDMYTATGYVKKGRTILGQTTWAK